MTSLLLPSEVVKGTLMCLPVFQVKMSGGASSVARGFAISVMSLNSVAWPTLKLGGTTVAMPHPLNRSLVLTLSAAEDGEYARSAKMGPPKLWNPSPKALNDMEQFSNSYWSNMMGDRRLSPSYTRIKIDHSAAKLDADAALKLLIARGSQSGCIVWLASAKSMAGGTNKPAQDKALLVEGLRGILNDAPVNCYSSAFLA